MKIEKEKKYGDKLNLTTNPTSHGDKINFEHDCLINFERNNIYNYNDLSTHIQNLSDQSTSTEEFILKIYNLYIPLFPKIKKMQGWPKISPQIWSFISQKTNEIYRKEQRNNDFTFLWLNYGFSSAEYLKKMEVDFSKMNVEIEE